MKTMPLTGQPETRIANDPAADDMVFLIVLRFSIPWRR